MKKANGELPNLNPPPAKPIPSWASPELRRWVREIRKKPPPSLAVRKAAAKRRDKIRAMSPRGRFDSTDIIRQMRDGGRTSRILLIGTEGATDPQIYRRIVGLC